MCAAAWSGVSPASSAIASDVPCCKRAPIRCLDCAATGRRGTRPRVLPSGLAPASSNGGFVSFEDGIHGGARSPSDYALRQSRGSKICRSLSFHAPGKSLRKCRSREGRKAACEHAPPPYCSRATCERRCCRKAEGNAAEPGQVNLKLTVRPTLFHAVLLLICQLSRPEWLRHVCNYCIVCVW